MAWVVANALGSSVGFLASVVGMGRVVAGVLGGAVVSFALVVGATFTGTLAFAVAGVGAVLLGALAGSVGFLTSAEIGGVFVFDRNPAGCGGFGYFDL